jgi:hypothetical protein
VAAFVTVAGRLFDASLADVEAVELGAVAALPVD